MSDWLAQLADADTEVQNLEDDLAQSRAHRDSLMVAAADSGVTPYRIAKHLGMTAPAVHKAIARAHQVR